ncbi:MAG: hypothetical protein KJ630_15540 [Proteobacteria bacterium]|nr:hypothetical protein [Pseudomonadota bacterium]
MKFKNKLIFGAFGLVVIIMAICIVIVSITVRKQSVSIAGGSIKQAFTIILNKLEEQQDMLLSDTQQTIMTADIGGGLNLIRMYINNPDGHLSARYSYQKMSTDFYSTASLRNIYQMCAYDIDGNIMAFARVEADTGYMIFPSKANNKPVYLFAQIKPGDQITDDSFKVTEIWPFEPSLVKADVTDKAFVSYEKDENSIRLVSHASASSEVSNFKTKKRDQVMQGMVTATRKLDQSFTAQIALFSGNEVHIFSGTGKDNIL